MAPTTTKGKRSVTFKKEWELQYGVQVSTIDPGTKEATSVVCLFCKTFGREQTKVTAAGGERKRKRTERVQYYSKPFRPDGMKRHNVAQHGDHWNSYQELSMEEKKKYFVERESAAVVNMRSFVQPQAGTDDLSATSRPSNTTLSSVSTGERFYQQENLKMSDHPTPTATKPSSSIDPPEIIDAPTDTKKTNDLPEGLSEIQKEEDDALAKAFEQSMEEHKRANRVLERLSEQLQQFMDQHKHSVQALLDSTKKRHAIEIAKALDDRDLLRSLLGNK